MPKERKISAAELSKRVDAVIEYCTETDTLPTDYVLQQVHGIPTDSLSRWRVEGVALESKAAAGEVLTDGEQTKVAYMPAIKRLDQFRAHFAQMFAVNHPNLQSLAIFWQKQACYGGFSDKPPEKAGSAEIVVKFDGIGGADSLK